MKALTRIALHTLFLLMLYSMVRLLFWRANAIIFHDAESLAILKALVMGMRYDLAAIAITNLAIYLIFLLLARPTHKGYWFGLASLLINGFALALNMVDLEYFKFTGKRMTLEVFSMQQDIKTQAGQIALYYWYYSLIILVFFILCAWVGGRILRKTEQESLGSVCLSLLVLGAGGGLAARGGWQVKPLIPAQAFVDSDSQLGVLVLNSTFTILKSWNKDAVEELHLLPWDQVQQIVTKPRADGPAWTGKPPKNIVLVVMESFGWEYVFPPENRPSYTPFIQELAARGTTFSQAYANGRRSIDAIPALLAGIPAWMEPPFITSPYQTNKVRGLPEILDRHGFRSLFFHGGNNGTMFFDVMAKRFGFHEYVGANEYPKQGDHDGKWGIFDEPFLQFTATRLAAEKQPFFATIFTLSSHHPYTIPKIYEGRFPKGALEIHESLGYADHALRRFYETAKAQSWFEDTLFIFTADHTSKFEFPSSDTLRGHFQVPLLFIMNDSPLPFAQSDQLVQQLDLSPTLLDMLQLPPEQFSHFGSSLCRPLKRPGIVLFENEKFHLIYQQGELSWSPEVDKSPGGNESLLYLQAAAHYFNNGMVRNRLIW